MRRITTSFIVLPLILLVFTLSGQNTYFVNLEGNDANDGLSAATAWRTIAYAASMSSPVSAGDTVYVKAGDYGEEEIFVDKNYERDAARISFIGYKDNPGDIEEFPFSYGDDVDATAMPLINHQNRLAGESINLSDVYSITFKNFQIANCISGISLWNSIPINSRHIFENIFIKNIGDAYSTAIGVKEADGNIIRNCLIVNATGAGMDIWGDNNLIEGCKVYSDESELTEEGTYTSMDYYIVLKGDNNVIRNCYSERVGNLEDVGHGIQLKERGENNLFVDCISKNMIGGCFGVRWSGVRNNEFRNCKAIGGLEDVTGFMIRDGASYNNFNACVAENCDAGVRFLLSGEDADYCGTNNTFSNCIFVNTQWAIDLNSWYYNSAPADDNLYVNCVFDNSEYLFNCERPNTGNRIVNSIIHDVNTFLKGDATLNFEYLYCDFFDNGFPMPVGMGNIDSNPLFVDGASGDYHLQPESLCIDNGTATDAPPVDFDGNARPQGNGYDIGIFEYTGPSGTREAQGEMGRLFPNPVGTVAFFQLGNDVAVSYKIFSPAGKIMRIGPVINGQINFKSIATGLYFVELYANDNARIGCFKVLKK